MANRSRIFAFIPVVVGVLALAFGVAQAAAAPRPQELHVIPSDNRHIFFHGRWDNNTGSWWAGSGFKVNVRNLKTLAINLGEYTSWPSAPASISFDNGPAMTYSLTSGANEIPVPKVAGKPRGAATLVRVNVEGWQRNRIQFQSLSVNADASLVQYKPAKRAFQFIGDSLSAGQFLPQGVNQAWPYIVGEHFKAEHRINAQPGATLTDMESYGNVHGISFQFFRTEDTGFIWAGDHNYTTPWDFKRDVPRPTHIVIHVGANDASHGVTNDDFVKVYSEFLDKIRELNPRSQIFIFTPWGWPNADGNTYYYYQGQYERIVNLRKEKGDRSVHVVDTTGWVSFADVFPDNVHPNVEGMANIAERFIGWLEKFEKENKLDY
ncbi:SGNH hydrolase [Coprinopsis marcescibilis]|uniref:SGNH hydrolase n=1 Tax=Coprinopsis marcescibilis TaxID=230819 RepID=A0A5C3KHF5_COPMA|nr:SGNH hydrolase [Coprinopsis marcescibilis]